jgi:hypothetical protein
VNTNQWIGPLLAMAGLMAIAIALWDGYATRQFVKSAQRSPGTVTALFAGPAHPEIEYVDQSGVRHTFPGTGWISHQTGSTVKVLYIDHGDHQTAKLDEWGSLWFSACMTGVLGTALLIAGAFQIWRR